MAEKQAEKPERQSIKSFLADIQETPAYRLGWRMAENGKPRPDGNIITWYRRRGLRWGFHTDAQLEAAEQSHRLLLAGWDASCALEHAA